MENIGVEAQVIDSFFVFLQEGFTDKIAVLAMERNFGEAIDIFFELFEEIQLEEAMDRTVEEERNR